MSAARSRALVALGVALASAGALAACGDSGRRGGPYDAGTGGLDAGGPPGDAAGTDAGPRVSGDGGADRDAGSAVDADAGPARDAGGSSTDAGAPPPPTPLCQRACTAPADCASGTALYDATHYACESGACRWLGCRGDPECAAAFGSSRYACRTVSGLSLCVQTCAVAADCATSAAFDADNYACDAGACRYLGCNDDAECASTFTSDRYVCRDVLPPDTGLPIPTAARNCVLGCAGASDCSSRTAAFDADNYTCVAAVGACRYTGCNTDAECASTFMSASYVCR